MNEVVATGSWPVRPNPLKLCYAGIPCQSTSQSRCFKFADDIDATDYYVSEVKPALVNGMSAIWSMPVPNPSNLQCATCFLCKERCT